MTVADPSVVFQQLGELLSGIRGLGQMIEVRDDQARRMQDLIRTDLSTLRQDQRDLEEKLDCVVCVMQHDLQALRLAGADAARSVNELVQVVQDLRSPVAEIMALRARAAGLVLGLGVFGSAVLWVAEPVYRWFVEQHFLKQ